MFQDFTVGDLIIWLLLSMIWANAQKVTCHLYNYVIYMWKIIHAQKIFPQSIYLYNKTTGDLGREINMIRELDI